MLGVGRLLRLSISKFLNRLWSTPDLGIFLTPRGLNDRILELPPCISARPLVSAMFVGILVVSVIPFVTSVVRMLVVIKSSPATPATAPRIFLPQPSAPISTRNFGPGFRIGLEIPRR